MRRLARVIAILATVLAASQASAVTLVDCPFKGGTGDPLIRGFYVTSFDAVTLSTVTLGHAADVEGERTISLTARMHAYNGTLIRVATATRTIGPTMTATTFDFGDVRVPEGITITFTQAVVAGNAAVTYDRGQGDCTGVTRTTDSSPPLSEFERDTVGLVITGSPSDDGNATTLTCPLDPLAAGEAVTRGFYVTRYGGTKLNTVSLFHRAAQQGSRRIRLTARLGSYDGPLIGQATAERLMNTTRSETVFNFQGAAVPAGSTIAFTQEVQFGDPAVTHDVGFGPCPDVTQTNGAAAPLDTFRRASVGVTITGRVATAGSIPVIEYFHNGFGHYFMTADPDEIAGLDAGAFGGVFTRTGQSFKARDGPADGAIAVCRFFTVAFAPLSSHVYTAEVPECTGLKSNPAWQYEKIAFYIAVSKAGVCPDETLPVWRLYNDGMTGAPNHRYTRSLAIHDDFVQNRGWTSEGVRFCAPL